MNKREMSPVVRIQTLIRLDEKVIRDSMLAVFALPCLVSTSIVLINYLSQNHSLSGVKTEAVFALASGIFAAFKIKSAISSSREAKFMRN